MIKILIKDCRKTNTMPVIYYTGQAEKETGNWCFANDMISLSDIFNIIETQCEYYGKIGILCDCSYSGNWCHEYVKKFQKKFRLNLLLFAASQLNCNAQASAFTLKFALKKQNINIKSCMVVKDLKCVITDPC